MNILISPYSQKLKTGKENAKNYPYWKELVTIFQENGNTVTQVGVNGEMPLVDNVKFNKPLEELGELIKEYDIWVSVDNFFPHLANHYGKPGVVLWGTSDPEIFGYKQNKNLLKNRANLRKNQFDIWDSEDYKSDVFYGPVEIYHDIIKFKGE